MMLGRDSVQLEKRIILKGTFSCHILDPQHGFDIDYRMTHLLHYIQIRAVDPDPHSFSLLGPDPDPGG